MEAALLACLLSFVFKSVTAGQTDITGSGFESQSTVAVRGRVVLPASIRPHDVYVDIVEGGRRLERANLQPDGSFELRGVPSGTFLIRVLDLYGRVMLTDFVTAGRYVNEIELRLPERERPRPPSGRVSLRSLKPLPRVAQKELRRAEQAARAGKRSESLDHLQRALVACPDCIQVHTNLGAAFMRAGEFGKAAEAFRRAVEIDPDAVLAQNNLAMALVTLKEYEGAEAAANRVLRLDPTSVVARYALGLIALGRNQCTTEALQHLKAAAEVFPTARLSAARLLGCRGDARQAIGELEKYLAQPNVEERERVEAWLAALRAQAR